MSSNNGTTTANNSNNHHQHQHQHHLLALLNVLRCGPASRRQWATLAGHTQTQIATQKEKSPPQVAGQTDRDLGAR